MTEAIADIFSFGTQLLFFVRRNSRIGPISVAATQGFLKSILQRFICYDQVDVSNLAWVKQIVHHVIQDEHDVWNNRKHRGCSSLEFVLNQIIAMPETATATVFRLVYGHAAIVPVNAWQHCVEYSLLGAAMTFGSKELPDGDCRPLRRGAGHREHGGPFPLPLPEIMLIRSGCARPRYLQQRLCHKRAQQRLFSGECGCVELTLQLCLQVPSR